MRCQILSGCLVGAPVWIIPNIMLFTQIYCHLKLSSFYFIFVTLLLLNSLAIIAVLKAPLKKNLMTLFMCNLCKT